MPAMTRPGPFLHVLAILLLVVPAALLLASRDAPAEDAHGPPRKTLAAAEWPLDAAARRGRDVYERYCIGCHGDEGRGDGPAARWLNPMPRNFQSAQFKFRSTPTGALPTADDLLRTVTCGLAGSSMPGFPLVPEHERRDVVRYVQHLTGLGLARKEVEYLLDEEGMTLDEIRADVLPGLREEVAAKLAGVERIPVPAMLPATDASLALGRDIFDRQCAACHGDTGRGDGASSYTLRDTKDAEIRPRDFTTGVFRAGSTPQDLYLRLRSGLAGTPMPAIPGTDEEIWAQVHYILAMRDPDAQRPYLPYGCGGEEDR